MRHSHSLTGDGVAVFYLSAGAFGRSGLVVGSICCAWFIVDLGPKVTTEQPLAPRNQNRYFPNISQNRHDDDGQSYDMNYSVHLRFSGSGIAVASAGLAANADAAQ